MDQDTIESFQHAGFTVTIYRDDDCASPRENENLCVMACAHRGYFLGDLDYSQYDGRKVRRNKLSEGLTAKEMIRRIRSEGEKVVAMLPLFAYEHGGITISCGAFSDYFDSGQVGWAYVTKASAEAMGCVGAYHNGNLVADGVWNRARWEAAIREEVETYDQYLTGQCYGYVVHDSDGDELESCWGFVGDLDYVRQEARSAAEHCEPLGRVHATCTATCEAGDVATLTTLTTLTYSSLSPALAAAVRARVSQENA